MGWYWGWRGGIGVGVVWSSDERGAHERGVGFTRRSYQGVQ